MTRAEIIAHNHGVTAVVAIAEASAASLRKRLTEKPTRFNYAIAALDGLVEAGNELVIPLPPDRPEAAVVDSPKPSAPHGGASVHAGAA